jgi:hypothetical protein
MADRLIAWLEDCGYEIKQKAMAANDAAAAMTDEPVSVQLAQVC